MKKWFTWVEFLVVFSFLFYSLFFIYVACWAFVGCVGFSNHFLSGYLVVDMLSVYFVFLTVVVGLCSIIFKSWLSGFEFLGVVLSQCFAMVSYVCVHSLLFWVCYELSMLCLLFLIFFKSPYSERLSAFWYFLGYILCSSLPMLVVFLVLSDRFGSFSIVLWDVSESEVSLMILLAVLFFSKVPVFPFQNWLPVVHAEASSMVSVCLSGYVMKLGVLGLVRFCWWVLPSDLLVVGWLGFLVFCGVVYFVLSLVETDNKRWLALLSLAHITVVPLCLKVCEGEGLSFSYSYCLGHALSASLGFMIFWVFSEYSGGRSWFMMKNGLLSGYSGVVTSVVCFCFCGSLPFSLQIFCELWLLGCSLNFDSILVFSLLIYFYFSGLVPMVCLGHLLSRYRDVFPYSLIPGGVMWGIIFLVFLNCFVFIFL